ncbi:MAG: HAD hydrolase family protein, partial [Methanomassiliicoccales archaeon]
MVDIDGTITDPRRRLEVSAMESLRRVQENGVITMVASGNVLPVSYGLSTFVGMNG